MSSISIQAGDIAITCESPEQAAVLIRALQGAPVPRTDRAERAPRKARGGGDGAGRVSKRRSRSATSEKPTGRGAVREAVLAVFAKKPQTTAAELAMQVYGADSKKEKARIHATIHSLSKQGKLKAAKGGGWTVTK